jgi:methionine aminotransferase
MNAPHDTPMSPSFPSRLPDVGTTIFTVMSALAAEKGAVNLGQGFPDFGCDPRIVDAVANAMRDGHNQYPPMAGAAPLRQAISDKIANLYGRRYDATSEITVTAGATQALLTAILCTVHPGDEVIVVEPNYDSYVPSIELAGGKPVFVTLEAPDYTIPFDKLAAAITPKTRLLLINTPHNPTGTVWRVRAHGVRRRAARKRCALPRTGAAQFRGVELRQDLSRYRLEGWLRRRARRAHG